jgi:gliding motility-associated-like protein
VIGGADDLLYTWSPGDGLTCTNCDSVTIEAVNDVAYTVIAVDEMGCADTSMVFIHVNDTLDPQSEFPLFFVPNAFTPNGDGNNDEFKVIVTDYVSFRLIICNRWGEKLFETNNPMEGWDGTHRGERLNPGVYVYYVDVGFINNAKPPEYLKQMKGSLTLIR